MHLPGLDLRGLSAALVLGLGACSNASDLNCMTSTLAPGWDGGPTTPETATCDALCSSVQPASAGTTPNDCRVVTSQLDGGGLSLVCDWATVCQL